MNTIPRIRHTLFPFGLLLFFLSLSGRLHAQFNLNDPAAIDTSTYMQPVAERWDIEFTGYREIPEVILERLEGDMMIVTQGSTRFSLPVDSILTLRRVTNFSRGAYHVMGFIAGGLVSAAVAPETWKRDCGHPCFQLPPLSFLIVRDDSPVISGRKALRNTGR